MRYGQHWTGWPPDDPPTDHEGYRWCAKCGSWECECDESETEEKQVSVIRIKQHPFWCWCETCKERE